MLKLCCRIKARKLELTLTRRWVREGNISFTFPHNLTFELIFKIRLSVLQNALTLYNCIHCTRRLTCVATSNQWIKKIFCGNYKMYSNLLSGSRRKALDMNLLVIEMSSNA